MRSGRAAVVLALATGLTLLAGCGGGSNTGEVTGTVTFEGVAVEEGAITFTPTDGKSSTAGGNIKGGKYSVDKVPTGAAKVSITGSKVVGQKAVYPGPNSPTMPITINPIPEKFNEKTELTFDVQPGRNEKNWDLKGK